MLKLLIGKDWVANRDAILSMVAQDVAARKSGRVLMVPELISHDMERRLCAAAGDTASRYAEVLSFTRLARRVADMVGCAAEECLDNGGRVVAMAAAARQMHSKLKAYASVETKPEFLSGLVDAVDEFKRCCIRAVDLKAAARQTTGSLAQKLEELSLLLEAYDGLCSQGKRDPRDQMHWLLEQLEDTDFAKEHVFYIDGFPDFTRQHLAILEHLIQNCECVTVSLNCDQINSSKLSFEKAGITAAELIRCAEKAEIPVEIITIPERFNELVQVRELLFQGRIEPTPAVKEKLRLYQTDSVYSECVAAAEHIMHLVRSGCRYRDISVVCTDMAVYQDVLRLVFSKFKIPLYQSGTEDILQKSVVTTVLSALEAALGGLDRRDVLRYLKSALSPLELEETDLLENYAIVWGISGSRWAATWENHPEGLGVDWNDQAAAQLQKLNDVRNRAIMPLVRLQQSFRQANKLSDQISALYAFLEDISLASRLEQLATKMDEAGDNRSAQILNQLWEILLGAMEQMHDVLGDTVWEQDVFVRLFTLLLSQYDVGTIPPVLDAVMAGSVSAMRCQQPKHLIVLGAIEGSLPGYGGSKGVLTDQERVALRQLGVPLTGGAMEGLQAEFAEIYGVFCGASDSVTVSCVSGQPSFVYRRLSELAGGEMRTDMSVGVAAANEEEAGAYLARFHARAAADVLGVEDVYENTLRRASYSLGNISEKNICNLYGSRLRLSASQVDKQAECRFAYFLRYGLRAKERKEAAVDPAEFGTYIHAVLEQTARKVMEQGGFHVVTEEETLRLAVQYADQYAAERFGQLDSKRISYLFQRNVMELEMIVRELWQELSISRFDPVGFEVNFGDGEQMAAIPIGGRKMDAELHGYVDRVDSWQELGQNYFRVVDYKTGKKKIDYCDMFHGIGLQMLLYLFALEQSGEKILGKNAVPAGVQYFPARAPMLSADGYMTEEEADQLRTSQWKRSGLLLADSAVLDAMEPEGNVPRLCVKRKKDGSITGDYADREQLRQLKAYIRKVLGDMVDDIASGNVTPNPYTRGTSHNACDYCPFGAVCHKTTVSGRRNFKKIDSQEFWARIGKELNRDG